MGLEAILDELAKVEKEVEGIREAYPRVPESLKNLPCILNIPNTGEYDISFGGNNRHTISITIIVDRAILPQSQNKILPLMEVVKSKIDDNEDLHGACSSCSVTGYRNYGVHSFGGLDYFGVVFDLDVLE